MTEPASPQNPPAVPPRPKEPRTVSGFGIALGLTLFAASLTPSLVPRAALLQGVLGGAVFAVGYGAGVAAISLWRWLGLREPSPRHGAIAGIVAALAGLGLAALALSHAAEWQDSIRVLMGLPPVETTHPTKVAGLAAATALAIIAVAYLIKLVFRFARNRVHGLVPERVAILIGLVVAFALFGTLINGVLVRYALQVLDQSYATLDSLFEPEIAAPTDPAMTGSSASLLDWTELGRDGRRFIARMPTKADIEAFWGGEAMAPQRVYVGLGADDDVEARAALALAEMERIGAFEREILIVAVPTGTGFMEEAAITPLEFLHRGNVATVALQYSYLQSPFSLIFEPEYGAEAARALLRVVYEHWTELDHANRPRLYLQGVSLGALSSERSLRLHEVLGDPLNGAVWSGPPFPSPVHAQATAERDAGSPAWLPRFENGSFIRFTRDGSDVGEGARWGPMRIIYLQHPSDPIVFFGLPALWRSPPWLAAPRGPDVSPQMRWYPVVTALQLAADMALSNNAPVGFGHQYSAASYIDVWTEVTDPNVTADDIARLKALFPNGKDLDTAALRSPS